jgi:hypothetical protein
MAVVGNPRDQVEGRSVSVLPGPANASMFPLAAQGPLDDDVARTYAARLGLELPKSPRVPRVDALG